MNTQEANELFTCSTEGILRWKKDCGSRAKIGSIAGHISSKNGYVRIFHKKKSYLAHRIVWIVHNVGCYEDNFVIDHIDGNRANNSIKNLRIVSKQENNQNLREATKNNKIGKLGVTYYRTKNKYRATIVVNHKQLHLGYYDTADQAYEAYVSAKRIYHSSSTL